MLMRSLPCLLVCSVQIASVLGYLGSAEHEIYPCLVVVPNSYVWQTKRGIPRSSLNVLIKRGCFVVVRTITNWVREFEKWSPHLRVVNFFIFYFLHFDTLAKLH